MVAGPWEDIEREYMYYQDLIWIDEDEVYMGENSVLTYKTISYFNIVQRYATGARQALKTDDDSYLHMLKFKNTLFSAKGINYDYYGHCPQYQLPPVRDPGNKWALTNETYPEPMFPLYCQGTGFGLSRSLMDCVAANTPYVRYMPFEDVAIGILAERCGHRPIMMAGIKQFRAETEKEKACVRASIPMAECYRGEAWPPKAAMNNKLIQHRVDSDEDMRNLHLSLKLAPRKVRAIPANFMS